MENEPNSGLTLVSGVYCVEVQWENSYSKWFFNDNSKKGTERDSFFLEKVVGFEQNSYVLNTCFEKSIILFMWFKIECPTFSKIIFI